MPENDLIRKVIAEQSVMPLFYHDDADTCIAIARALYEAGGRLIEFTNRGNHALHNFKILLAARNEQMPDLLLGVGTIKNANEAEMFINAGADFLVSPFYDEAIAEVVHQHKKLWLPGCMTPTEIHVASEAGFNLLKLFPGNVLGPDYVKGILPLFPGVDFMVTGGVDNTQESLAGWLQSGVVAVGLGSNLITTQIVAESNFNLLKQNMADVLQKVVTLKRSGGK